MKRALKWIGFAVATLLIVGFVLFLYYIPPFTSMAPEEFVQPELAGAPLLDDIKDPRERLLAERGKYIVLTHDCNGCHTPGDNGPDYNRYLAGGAKHVIPGFGTAYSRNLTPDPETGLGGHTDEEILAVLRSGVMRDGRLINNRMMPWATWSNWPEEDKFAVVVFLRHLKPVHNRVPDFAPDTIPADSTGKELIYGGDYSERKFSSQ
jgi:hypothetical protein